MMELSHSLTLNEEALKEIPEQKKPVFIFEWLRFLDRILVAAQKSDIKGCQKKLVSQLLEIIADSPGPPTRRLVARCLATLFSVGDTFLLFDTVNKCNDILKNKDDSPSFLQTKLGAICCIGSMYQKLGRMMGRSYEETVQILIKCLRNAESLTRIEVMLAFEKICCGMGVAISNTHKEMYKAAKHCLTDRVMAVRCAAVKCLLEIMKYAPFMYSTELESMAGLCFRAFDGTNYEARYAVAKLLGTLVAATQQPPIPPTPGNSVSKNAKEISLDDAIGVLMSGFLKGGTGFLKGTGEIIKGSSTINREVRVGVTYAYVIFIQIQGVSWLERNMNFILNHILDLVANPKAASSHIDAVYSRKCINFILRSTFGRMLCEKAQASVCKQLAVIVAKQMSTIDFNPENVKDYNQETLFGQHLLVCALQEMGLLMLSLGTTASNTISDPSCGLVEAAMTVLVHPCYAARLAAAWCLRCICIAVPSQCTTLINRCLESLDSMKTTSEAISGCSGALAAVLGGVRFSPLGVPHTKGKIIFNTAEELLRSANQNSRLSLHRTQAGWLLIGSIITLGSAVVRGLLPRMVLLWRNSFPRSNKELESEKARGDAFTWQVTLEGRGGALSSIHSFLLNCPELVNDDIIRRLLTPIESAISMLINMNSVLKSYGQHIKAPIATVRHRLYETLSLIPPHAFEGSYTHILRLLVSEFTLSENPANTNCSTLRAACHTNESVLLGASSLLHNDHRIVEEQLLTNSAAGSGALEHDPCCLYRLSNMNEELPGPLPLGVAVIDSSVALFGSIFPRVANKHRLQILDHFVECIRHAKSSRADAVTMNVFAALLAALKGLTEAKGNIGQEDVRKAATTFIVGTLTNSNPILRCAAAESLGRLAQVVGDPRFTAELAQTSFDRLKSARDVASRTGHSLALGCIHRYVGGMGSSQHLNTSVSILLALAQDSTSPVVQVWSLYALSLIAESGGPMFRGYVEPSLSLTLKLLLTVPQSYVDVHNCIGKVLSALITVIGPELQGNSPAILTARSSFLCACAIMQDHQDALVQAEATACLQQLHLFTPRHVNLSSFVPTLCRNLSSDHLLLRKAAVSCLRQLAQREAREVCEHALTLINDSNEQDDGLIMTDSGLPGKLFRMLDTETDAQLIKDVHDTLTSMLQMLAADNLSQWLSLCRSVLAVTSEQSVDSESAFSNQNGEEVEEEGDDLAEFKTGDDGSKKKLIQPRWPTRVFATECVHRIIATCQAACSMHFDLQLAKELHLSKNKGDYLVLHLSELIRMAFIAATSDSDELRLEGLKTLHIIIEKFSKVPEPEFPGHLLLEQFQAQVGAALRPAFSSETASHVTAAACAVCSAWIGSGVAKDLNDLRRVHQLLVSSLTKLHNASNANTLYNESVATLEKLSILKAWAEVYIVAMTNEGRVSDYQNVAAITPEEEENDEDFGQFESKGESLLTLVQPELDSLAEHWLAALRDHALLLLPPEYSSQLPRDGGAFYTNDTMDSCRPHYCSTWPALLHAATLWLTSDFFIQAPISDDEKQTKKASEYFGLIFGVCMEALCNSRSACPLNDVITCLQSLHALLDLPYPRQMLTATTKLPVEVCNVMHRLILTKDQTEIHQLCMDVLKQTITAVQEQLTTLKKKKFKELYPANQQDMSLNSIAELDLLGEGSENGDINQSKGFVFSVLEVCLCLIVRQLPALNPAPLVSSTIQLKQSLAGNELSDLISKAISVLEMLPDLCSPPGAVSILPTVLYLTTSVLKEMTSNMNGSKTPNMAVTASLQALRTFVTHKYCSDPLSSEQWKSLLQSSMAKIIDLAKTESTDTKVDEACMMLALSVFVLNAPADVVLVPNLQYPCINYFRQCFQSENIQVRVKCVQTLKHIFKHNDKAISNGYILALAPRLVEYLHLESTKCPSSDTELHLTVEIINAVESLIRLAEPDKGVKVLGMLVPALVSYLLDDSCQQVTKYQKSLHDHSLQWLTKIGPQYPQEFKAVVSQNGDMRIKLEAAIRAKAQKSKNEAKTNSIKIPVNATPTIKLKTDFTNFQS